MGRNTKKMAYLSRNELEVLGGQVFADYKRLPSLKGRYIQRVEPETLARELCGLDIAYYHLSRSGTLLGATSTFRTQARVMDDDGNPLVYPLDGRTILIESDLRNNEEQQGRYHFTLTHEVAHQILGRMFPEHIVGMAARIHYSKATSSPAYPVTDWTEWQANALASALLMPMELVYNALCRFDLSQGIKVLNKVFFSDVYERFCQVAETLGTSKQALALRLKRLGLLQEDYLDDPYRLVNVEVD